MNVRVEPVSLLVSLRTGQVQFQYVIHLESGSFEGVIGGGESTPASPEITEKAQALAQAVVDHVNLELGLSPEEDENPLGDDEMPLSGDLEPTEGEEPL